MSFGSGTSVGGLGVVGVDQVDRPVNQRVTLVAFFTIDANGEAVLGSGLPSQVTSRGWRPDFSTWRRVDGFVFSEVTSQEGSLPNSVPSTNGPRFYCGDFVSQAEASDVCDDASNQGVDAVTTQSSDSFPYGGVRLHDGRLFPLSKGDVVVYLPPQS